MKITNLDYNQFMIFKKMLKNQVYWLDRNNNYKIYKFEISKISMEPLNNDIYITLELYPIDTCLIYKYHSIVDISYDDFFDFCFYSLELARKAQYKKMKERQGSLF